MSVGSTISQETVHLLKQVWTTLESDPCHSQSVQCNLPIISYLGVLQTPPSHNKQGLNKMDMLALRINRSTYTWTTVRKVERPVLK